MRSWRSKGATTYGRMSTGHTISSYLGEIFKGHVLICVGEHAVDDAVDLQTKLSNAQLSKAQATHSYHTSINHFANKHFHQ